MLLIESLKNGQFSNAERTIIDYMLEHKEGISNNTIKELANKTFTHPSVFIRLAQKNDFKGWVDFRKAFLEELQYLNSQISTVDVNLPFNEHDNFLRIASKLGNLNKNTIEDTLQLLDYSQLQKAVKIINESREVKIFAMTNNLELCHDFDSKMKRIQKNVTLCTVDSRYEAANSDSNTCAIIISYSGETDTIIELVPLLQQRGTKIIAITGLGSNSVSKKAHSILRISTREKLISKIAPFSTNTSICFLLDVLYSSFFSLRYKENLEYKINISKSYDHRRGSSEYMDEEFSQ